jgi:hypothetical protein
MSNRRRSVDQTSWMRMRNGAEAGIHGPSLSPDRTGKSNLGWISTAGVMALANQTDGYFCTKVQLTRGPAPGVSWLQK